MTFRFAPFRTTLFFLALAVLLSSARADQHKRAVGARRPHAHAQTRAPTSLNLTDFEGAGDAPALKIHLGKRFDNARFTFFPTGLNACGTVDHDSDFIVALNTHQWDGGSHCYAPITVSYQGKTANAKITDECMECPYGAIDLSPGLFEHLVPGGFGQGVAYGTWNYGGADDPKPVTTTTTQEKSKTTSHTSTKPTTTSHSTSTSTKTSTTKSSTSSTSTSTTSTSTSTAPTATVTSLDSGNLNQFNMAVAQLAGLMLAAPDSA